MLSLTLTNLLMRMILMKMRKLPQDGPKGRRKPPTKKKTQRTKLRPMKSKKLKQNLKSQCAFISETIAANLDSKEKVASFTTPKGATRSGKEKQEDAKTPTASSSTENFAKVHCRVKSVSKRTVPTSTLKTQEEHPQINLAKTKKPMKIRKKVLSVDSVRTFSTLQLKCQNTLLNTIKIKT